MARGTAPATFWSLTLARVGGCESDDSLDNALFAFGREHTEILIGASLALPTGVMRLIESSDLVGEALESGLVLEISSEMPSPGPGRAWGRFDLIYQVGRGNPYDIRGVYSSPEDGSTAEMVCFSERMRPLPKRAWMRVKPLPDKVMAWLLGEGVLGRPTSRQCSLHDFWDMELERPLPRAMPLPGPPLAPYGFL